MITLVLSFGFDSMYSVGWEPKRVNVSQGPKSQMRVAESLPSTITHIINVFILNKTVLPIEGP